jgi:hypothetical protein
MRTFLFLILYSIAATATAQMPDILAIGKTASKSRGFVISEQLFRINPEDGSTAVLKELGQLQSLSKGTTAFNHSENQLLIWAKTSAESDYEMFIIDVASGEMVQEPMAFAEQPIDIHYDMQQRAFFGIRTSATRQLEIITIKDNEVRSYMDLPQVKSIALGTSALNSNNGFYVFVGTDDNYQDRLYVVDLLTRQVLSQTLIKDFYFQELQFDIEDNKLYGLCRKRTNTGQFFFVEIVPLDARPIIITALHGLKNVKAGSSAFDQNDGLFIYDGSTDNGKFLYALDAVSGDILFQTENKALITALECSNTEFANIYFAPVQNKELPENGGVKTEVTETETKTIIETAPEVSNSNTKIVEAFTLNVSPTVVVNEVNVSPDIPNGEAFSVEVYDLAGVLWVEAIFFKSEKAEDNLLLLESLPHGIYQLKVESKYGIATQRIVKR